MDQTTHDELDLEANRLDDEGAVEDDEMLEEFDPFADMSDEELDAMVDAAEAASTLGLVAGDTPEGFRSGFVALVGRPNAGKSTFISAVSNARPKIADYPFTTLHPQLGVVRVGPEQSFVVADIPGLIEGASEGAGLGHLFLRHLSRTKLLLHLIDMAPFDETVDPAAEAKAIIEELRKYDEALYNKPRWLVLNKVDLIAQEEQDDRINDLLDALQIPEDERVFVISAATREGCPELVAAIAQYLDEERRRENQYKDDERINLEDDELKLTEE